jgi:Anti-sigma-K factor rskA
MTEHVDAELVPLLRGELSRARFSSVVAHLGSCDECAGALVEVAITHGALVAATNAEADLARAGPPLGPEPAVPSSAAPPAEGPPLMLTSLPQRRWRLALAAVLVTVAAVGTGLVVGRALGPRPAPVAATVTLQHLDAPASARGKATVRAKGATRQMELVTIGLPEPPPDHFYEIWLLQPSTNKMLALGVLPPSGSGSYSITAALMSQFSAVDVSLQENNGDPAHSEVSVLRGPVKAQAE